MSTSDENDELFTTLVDFVLPGLKPYDFALYALMLRLSHVATGSPDLVIGKRTLAACLGRGTRSSRGGNYQHIAEKLENLERDGYIVIGSTDRSGTRYEVRLPEAVPSVRERMAEAQEVEPAAVDYFGDPERRAELFERDGWRCRYCGETVTASTATLDHMVPQSKGGPNTPENLATCCLMCNSIKSGRTYEESAPAILERVAKLRGSEAGA